MYGAQAFIGKGNAIEGYSFPCENWTEESVPISGFAKVTSEGSLAERGKVANRQNMRTRMNLSLAEAGALGGSGKGVMVAFNRLIISSKTQKREHRGSGEHTAARFFELRSLGG